MRRIIFKLFHIQKALDSHAREIKNKNKALAGLRQEQRKHDKALEDARAEQAKARGAVMQKEKKIKKAEKALELRVRISSDVGCWILLINPRRRNPISSR